MKSEMGTSQWSCPCRVEADRLGSLCESCLQALLTAAVCVALMDWQTGVLIYWTCYEK